MLYIELGALIQGKFDLKRCVEVKRTVVFQVVPYRHCRSSSIHVVFSNLCCPFTSALLYCRRFPAHDFFQKVQSILFSHSFISDLYSRKVHRLRGGPNYPMAVQITPICSKVFVPW